MLTERGRAPAPLIGVNCAPSPVATIAEPPGWVEQNYRQTVAERGTVAQTVRSAAGQNIGCWTPERLTLATTAVTGAKNKLHWIERRRHADR